MTPKQKAELQFYFNRAWRGVTKQGRGGYNVEHGRCMYYDATTKCRCAVGHMVDIPTAKRLQSSFGQTNVAAIMPSRLPRRFGALIADGYDMRSKVREIQMAHDAAASGHALGGDSFVRDFHRRMRRLAERFGLEVPDNE